MPSEREVNEAQIEESEESKAATAHLAKALEAPLQRLRELQEQHDSKIRSDGYRAGLRKAAEMLHAAAKAENMSGSVDTGRIHRHDAFRRMAEFIAREAEK